MVKSNKKGLQMSFFEAILGSKPLKKPAETRFCRVFNKSVVLFAVSDVIFDEKTASKMKIFTTRSSFLLSKNDACKQKFNFFFTNYSQKDDYI